MVALVDEVVVEDDESPVPNRISAALVVSDVSDVFDVPVVEFVLGELSHS